MQPDTVQAGATISLPIQLGTIDEPVTDAYGIAFSIVYDPEMVVPGSPRLRFNGWLGDAEDGLLGLYRDVPDAGRIDVAMVRTDAQNISGHGTIGELVIIMEDVILRGLVDVEVPIRTENVQLISYQEVGIPTAPMTTQILVENVTNTEELDPRYRLQVAPNPTNGPFTLQLSGLQLEKVTVYNANGQVVQTFFAEQATYDLTTQPAGTYFLEVQTNHGVAHQKVVKY